MKMFYKLRSATLVLAIATAGSTGFAAETCEMALRGNNEAYTRLAKWRAASTHEVAAGIVLTNKPREQKLQRIKASMNETVLNQATPVLRVVETSEASLDMTEQAHYENGVYAKYNVSTGGEPVLRATLLLPVSGHTGVEDAKKWATTDTYTIWAEVDGKKTFLAQDVKSLDLITLQDVAIPLEKDKEVKVYYQRSGNSIYGFVAGRVLGFTWDGK